MAEFENPGKVGLGGGSVAVLRVHNGGPPIPKDSCHDFRSTEALRDAGIAEKRTPGSIGWGLYIVREIVQAKGGTVSVSSKAEEGTTFTVCIPRFLPLTPQSTRFEGKWERWKGLLRDWLHGTPEDAAAIAQAAPVPKTRFLPVSRAVGNVRNTGGQPRVHGSRPTGPRFRQPQPINR